MEIRKTKTDLIDSAIIADMLHYHEPPVATAIDNLKLYQLRELCRVRQRNVDFRKKEKKEGEVLRPGFEPESLARKARMIGRTTLPEHNEYRSEATPISHTPLLNFRLMSRLIVKIN